MLLFQPLARTVYLQAHAIDQIASDRIVNGNPDNGALARMRLVTNSGQLDSKLLFLISEARA